MNETDIEQLGPIDFLVIEFPPGSNPDGSGLNVLIELVERGIIRVVDLAFVAKDEHGVVSGIDIADVGLGDSLDVTLFAEASSGLLGNDDLVEAGEAMLPGTVAALLVYENTWAAPFAAALRKNGAQLVANGRIPVQAVLAALDATEPVT